MSLRHAWLCFLLLVLTLASVARADTWASYGTRVTASPDGRRYAIVSTDFAFCGKYPARMLLVRRDAGRPPAESCRLLDKELPKGGVPGLMQPGDELVAEVALPQTPAWLRVLDDGRVVAVDCYGAFGHHDLALLVAADGSSVTPVPRLELFPGFEERFRGVMSSMWDWHALDRVDPVADEWIVVGADLTARAVDLATGRITDRDLEAALFGGTAPTSETALGLRWTLALRAGLSLPGRARVEWRDESLPEWRRLAAAAVLAQDHPDDVRDDLLAALTHEDDDLRRWAWAHVGGVLGVEVLPRYRAALLSTEERWADHLLEGLAGMGDAAVPGVVDLILDPACVDHHLELATDALARLEEDWTWNDSTVFGEWEQQLAFEAFRDEGELSALTTLLSWGDDGYGTLRLAPLALPTLELLRRWPDARAVPELERWFGVLGDHPHPRDVWHARLQAATAAALSACGGAG